MRIRAALRGARLAVVFLTRVPAGGFPYAAEEVRCTSAWFPAVGMAIGLSLGAMWWLARPLDPLPAALLTFTVGLLLTGALHEDGLADTADALGGATDHEGVLRILKDSRIGTYGAAAVVASLTLRAALLASIPDRAVVALILSQAVSRLPAVWLLARLPYVTPSSRSKSRRVAAAGGWHLALAAVSVVGLTLLLMVLGQVSWGRAVGSVGVAAAVAIGCGAWYRRRLAGVTGDLLGASQQVTEAGVLMILAAHGIVASPGP